MASTPVETAQNTLAFELHPLYAAIRTDGDIIRRGEVVGLDSDLRRALIAPFDGVVRLHASGVGKARCVRLTLTERRVNRR